MIICFIGHRTVNDAEQVKIKLIDAISSLIADGADTFLFGSRSEFDALCWEAVNLDFIAGFQTAYENGG